MAKHETLQAQKRDVKGTTASKRLRRTGVVPAVIYGANQREYTIQLDAKSFFDLARKQASHNFLVDLEIEGANEKTKLAIVQDIQRDPLNGSLIHVDFRAVTMPFQSGRDFL
ncbi:MAG TPA: 50S ribosomal protein L25, partial [Verrucomicrobiales bacterium]|nr:50S ribosomal protein L25 [Verrucomicrobiales bacterium]